MDSKIVGAGDVRASWAAIQADAIAGQVVIVKRHELTTTVMMPPEWEGVVSNSTWQAALPLLRVKFPGKSDFALVTEVMQKVVWDQENGNNKSDLLYSLLWLASAIAGAVGVTGLTVDAIKRGGNELKNLWKGEAQP